MCGWYIVQKDLLNNTMVEGFVKEMFSELFYEIQCFCVYRFCDETNWWQFVK